MQRVSIERTFLWAQRFGAREWRLLLPVALAFLALPPLVLDLTVPERVWTVMAAAPVVPPALLLRAAGWVMLLGLAMFVIHAIGTLTITALALVPRISVREAIGVGAARIPALIGCVALVFCALLLVAIVASILFAMAGVSALTLQGLVTGVIMGAGLFAFARLSPLVPVLVERRAGPLAAMQLSWRMTQGSFWRVLGTLALYLIGSLVVLLALRTAIGAVLLLVMKLAGVPELGVALTAVLFRVGTALVNAGLYVLIAGLYRELVSADAR